MIRITLAFTPIFILAMLIQTAVIGRINLLSGNGDIILVVLAAWALQERVKHAWLWGAISGILIGSLSSAPISIYLATYLLVILLGRAFARRIWQAPLLAMLAVTFMGTLFASLLTFVYRLLFDGITMNLGDVFIQLILPSVLLNFLFAFALHPLLGDLASRLFPAEASA